MNLLKQIRKIPEIKQEIVDETASREEPADVEPQNDNLEIINDEEICWKRTCFRN